MTFLVLRQRAVNTRRRQRDGETARQRPASLTTQQIFNCARKMADNGAVTAVCVRWEGEGYDFFVIFMFLVKS